MRPDLEVADVFHRHGSDYRRDHDGHLGRVERRVMAAVEWCRTAALGGHAERCADCGLVRQAYNSCRNRHCPKCQGLARAQWLAERQAGLLVEGCSRPRRGGLLQVRQRQRRGRSAMSLQSRRATVHSSWLSRAVRHKPIEYPAGGNEQQSSAEIERQYLDAGVEGMKKCERRCGDPRDGQACGQDHRRRIEIRRMAQHQP